MGEVITTYKVMPTGVDVDLEKMEQTIKESIAAERIEKEPIAFGLTALIVTKIIPDDGKIMEQAEEKLKAIDGVASVEVTGVTKTL